MQIRLFFFFIEMKAILFKSKFIWRGGHVVVARVAVVAGHAHEQKASIDVLKLSRGTKQNCL